MAKQPRFIEVYGASDDLIELAYNGGSSGDEFGGGDDPRYLHFNDGTVLEIVYSPEGFDGCWKIKRVKEGVATFEVLFTATDGEGREYSDRIRLDNEQLLPVECWDGMEPSHEELAERLSEVDFEDLSREQLLAIHKIVKS